MRYRIIQSMTLLVVIMVAALLTACGPISSSDSGSSSGGQAGDDDEIIPTWQYKMTVVTDFGTSNALQENGEVIFNGTFSVLRPSGVIVSHEGKVTVSGSYRCREVNTDPPRMLEGTLVGEQTFSLDGLLIPVEDYDRFGVIPFVPLTSDEAQSEYTRISMPKVVDRNKVIASFRRENCTGSGFTPVIAEAVSFGEIPFFNEEYFPFFVVPLDSQAVFIKTIELNDEGSQLLSKAELCVAPAGKYP